MMMIIKIKKSHPCRPHSLRRRDDDVATSPEGGRICGVAFGGDCSDGVQKRADDSRRFSDGVTLTLIDVEPLASLRDDGKVPETGV